MLNQTIVEQAPTYRPLLKNFSWDYNRLWEKLIELHALTEKLTIQVTILEESNAEVDRDISCQLAAISGKLKLLENCRL